MADWKTLKSEVIHETPWIKVRRDEALNHLDTPLTYTFVELQHPSVFIVACNDKNKILIQKYYRYTLKRTIWELPAGHSEENEEPIEAAKRELLEEAGLVSDDWTNLGKVQQAIGVSNMPLFVCLARNVRQAERKTVDETEQVGERRFVSFNEMERMIKNGELINATDIGALYLAKLHRI